MTAPGLPRGSVVSVNVAATKGVRKKPCAAIELVAGHGVDGDGHAGPWHRQVSLLAIESIDTMRAKGLDVGPGDFAENVTTQGLAVAELPLGTRVRLGDCLVSSPRSARSATTTARSTAPPATASCRAKASSCACCKEERCRPATTSW